MCTECRMGHNKNTIPESGSSVPESHNESFRAEFSFPLRCFSPPLGQVVSCLLLFMEEEDALWMMCALIEDLLPPSYFSSTLLGVQTDQRVLRQLIVQYLPRLDRLLQEHDIGEDPPQGQGVVYQ